MKKRTTDKQKIVFTIQKNSEGKMAISVDMKPKLAMSKEAFEKMPMEKREMQNSATDIVRFVMASLAERDRALRTESE